MMKICSEFQNPFQVYAEGTSDEHMEDSLVKATENNLSRAVISALANSNPRILAIFIRRLAKHATVLSLQEKTETITDTLENADPASIEINFQAWPRAAIDEVPTETTVLIGISTADPWTRNERCAPVRDRRCDASIHVPGRLLLVFEFKDHEHSLDATQMSDYAHELGFFGNRQDIPRAQPGAFLATHEEAAKVQHECQPFVLDVSWRTVEDVLTEIKVTSDNPSCEQISRWLCGEAATFVKRSALPRYSGTPSILDWLSREDTPRHRALLRTLVREMGKSLEKGPLEKGSITFSKNADERPELKYGAEAAVYINLFRDGKPMSIKWLGKSAPAQLWFHFSGDEQLRCGCCYYIQAKGSQPSGKTELDWNRARESHLACADELERLFEDWVAMAPTACRLHVGAVKFRGKSKLWKGSGEIDKGFAASGYVSPQQALDFLRKNHEEIWRFPKVETGMDATAIEEAARNVRKPDLELTVPFSTVEFAACRDDPAALQKVLQRSLESFMRDK